MTSAGCAAVDELKADLPTTSIFTYDGKLIGVPYNNDFRVLIYNAAHLTDGGRSACRKPRPNCWMPPGR